MKLLQTFVVAARLLNFRKAADQLFLAQPTVTQHIRQLETDLRVDLFVREGKRVHLTQAGERFLTYAERLLKLYQEGVHELTGWQQGYRERLVLAVSPLVAGSTLPRVLRQFTREQPAIEVVVHIALSPDIPAMVTEGKAHMGLSRLPASARELTSEVWYTDPVRLVVPPVGREGAADAAEPAPDPVQPDWRRLLAESRLLSHNHPGYWDGLLLAIHRQGIAVRTMEVSLVDTTKRFIEEGLGISFLPHSTVARELAEGKLVEVETPGLPLPTAATYVIHRMQGAPEPVERFARLLRERKV